MMNTIVSWCIEGDDETSSTIPPAIFLSKPPSEITLGYIKRFYHGPKGVFMVKTPDEDDMSSLMLGDGPQEEKYHWTVLYDDDLQVPQCNAGGIMIKVRPLPFEKEKKELKPFLPFEEELAYTGFADQIKLKTKSGQPLWGCSYPGCQRTFNKSWRLKAHLRSHTGEKKPHRCQVEGCDKSFNEAQALRNHLRVHSGEHPFVCDVEGCGKSFTEKGNLRKHKRLHTGEKPYECSYEGCKKSFFRLDQLKVHIGTHTGTKPFLCPVEGCEKSFSYASGLKVHQRTHTEL